MRLEVSLLLRQVASKLRREPDRIEQSVSIVGQTNRISTRGWKALAVFGLGLANIRSVGSDKDQSHDVRINTGFRDDRSTVAMTNKDSRTILATEDAGDG